jgi:hypothetical protein
MRKQLSEGTDEGQKWYRTGTNWYELYEIFGDLYFWTGGCGEVKRFNTEGTEELRRKICERRLAQRRGWCRENQMQRRAPEGGRNRLKCQAAMWLTPWKPGAQQAAPLPVVVGGMARFANREVGVPRNSGRGLSDRDWEIVAGDVRLWGGRRWLCRGCRDEGWRSSGDSLRRDRRL